VNNATLLDDLKKMPLPIRPDLTKEPEHSPDANMNPLLPATLLPARDSHAQQLIADLDDGFTVSLAMSISGKRAIGGGGRLQRPTAGTTGTTAVTLGRP
jgi:hypothetical protein